MENYKIEDLKNSDWNYIKNNFYWCPGQLPDIYIENRTKGDWIKFVDYINKYFNVEFKLYEDQSVKNKINYNVIEDYWQGNLEDGCVAYIFIQHLQINFFIGDINVSCLDFSAKEIENLQDHNQLVSFIQTICRLLGKEASVHCEGSEEIVLARISANEVEYIHRNFQ